MRRVVRGGRHWLPVVLVDAEMPHEPVTGIRHDNPNLVVKYISRSAESWIDVQPVAADWRELGDGEYAWRAPVLTEEDDLSWLLYWVYVSLEPRPEAHYRSVARILDASELHSFNPLVLSKQLGAEIRILIPEARSVQAGYLREQISKSELPAIDIEASPVDVEDFAGYKRFTTEARIRLAAADARRSDAVTWLSETAHAVMSWLSEQDPVTYGADAFREARFELLSDTVRGEGTAVRTGMIRFNAITEV